MTFDSPLEELEYWLGVLDVDLRLGVDRRHVKATARLCVLLVEKLEQDPKLDRAAFERLARRLQDIQRQLQPVARQAGKFRVIDGARREWKFRGRAHSGSRPR